MLGERDQLSTSVRPTVLVDEFEIRRLPAEARPVVNELEVNLMASVLDERHRVVMNPVACWGAEVKSYTGAARAAQTFALALALLSGCGSTPPRESALVYAELQVAEARLERAATSLEACAADTADEANAAAAEACRCADELADTDSRIRCARAQERALMLRTEFEARCAESQADGLD